MSDKLSCAHGPLVWEVRARLQAAANPTCSLNTNVGSAAPRNCLAPNGAATILFSKWAGNRAEVVVAKEAVHVAAHNALGVCSRSVTTADLAGSLAMIPLLLYPGPRKWLDRFRRTLTAHQKSCEHQRTEARCRHLALELMRAGADAHGAGAYDGADVGSCVR